MAMVELSSRPWIELSSRPWISLRSKKSASWVSLRFCEVAHVLRIVQCAVGLPILYSNYQGNHRLHGVSELKRVVEGPGGGGCAPWA